MPHPLGDWTRWQRCPVDGSRASWSRCRRWAGCAGRWACDPCARAHGAAPRGPAHRRRQPHQQPRPAAGRRLAGARACGAGRSSWPRTSCSGPVGRFLRSAGGDPGQGRAAATWTPTGRPGGARRGRGAGASSRRARAARTASWARRQAGRGAARRARRRPGAARRASRTPTGCWAGAAAARASARRVTLRIGEPFRLTLDPAVPPARGPARGERRADAPTSPALAASPEPSDRASPGRTP